MIKVNCTGIKELDEIVYGESFAVVGPLSIYKRDAVLLQGVPSKGWNDVEAHLTQLSDGANTRPSANIVLRFQNCDYD